MTAIIISLGIAFILALLFTPVAKKIAKKIGAIDIPKDARRVHHKPIPRLGGIAIYASFIITLLIMMPVDRILLGILLGSVGIITIGILDDRKSLPAWLKLIVQILSACVPVLFGLKISILSNPIGWSNSPFIMLHYLSVPITILWIVGLTNAVNIIDGLDGLACGVSIIATVSVFIISVIVGNYPIALITAILCGSCLGFLPYNLHPASIFMGDTGATFLGYILACLSIQGLFKGYALISFLVPFLVLGFPIFETVSSIIRRLVHGKNPMEADRGHSHHKLIDMGYTQKQSVAILYSISAIMGLAAIILTQFSQINSLMVIVILLLILLCLWFVFFHLGIAKHNHNSNPPEDSQNHEDH